MADTNQGGLNGAYYGPPVPPPNNNKRSYHSVGRGSSCCCGPCCLLCTLFKFLLSIIIIIGIAVLVLWLVFRPSAIKAYVEDASLTKFTLSNSNTSAAATTLSYNLTLDLSIRNPNKRVAFYYDYIEARAVYDGHRFAYDYTLPSFFQDHKNTTLLHPAFQGTQATAVGTVATTFDREKGEGFFYIDVELYTRVRFKVWFIKTNRYSPKIYCTLKLPVPSSAGGSGAAGFSRTKCDVNFF